MAGDPGDLANLRDLAVPPPVSFWPPAPGVWIVAAGLAAALAVLLWWAVQRYRADAYRRAALAALDRIVAEADADAGEKVFAILKRTALAAYPRAEVAALTGTAWSDFVERTAGPAFDARAFSRLQACAFGAAPPADARDLETLVAQARAWVRGHRIPARPGEG